MSTMPFKSAVLVVTLGTGQSVICRALVNPQLEYFLSHELDLGAIPGGIYTKGIRYITGTSMADLTFQKFHFWDADDSVVTPLCNQQIISVVAPSEPLLVRFLAELGHAELLKDLVRTGINF